MNRDTSAYFQDILDNINKADVFILGMQASQFSKDEKTIYAVSSCIEIVGEAAKRIPDIIKQRYPDMPWKQMTGMRDIMIHAYSSVNVNKVWLTVKEDFPLVKPIVQNILKELAK